MKEEETGGSLDELDAADEQTVIESDTDSVPQHKGAEDDMLPPELPQQTVFEPTVREDPEGSEAAAEESLEELKFTGYTPPEKRGIGPFILKHKVGSALSLGVFIVVATAGGILLASSNDSEPAATPEQQASIAETVEEDTEEPVQEVETPEVVHISDAQFSLTSGGQQYGLETLDGERWLERSQFDWETFVEWEGWLFYTADRSVGESGGSSIGLEAFNYDTQAYASVTEISLLELASVAEPLYILNNFLYIRVESSASAGNDERKDATYRCKLDDTKGCIEFEEFYSGRGRVHIFSDTQYYIVDTTGEGGLRTTVISTYDVDSEKLDTVTEFETNMGIGSNFERVDAEGFVWLTETEGEDPSAAKVSRIYAVDTDGEIAFVIPANAIPVANAVPVQSAEVDYNQILYANEAQEVIFNTDIKQFEAPRERLIADSAQKAETVLSAEVRLNVPKEYLMRITN